MQLYFEAKNTLALVNSPSRLTVKSYNSHKGELPGMGSDLEYPKVLDIVLGYM